MEIIERMIDFSDDAAAFRRLQTLINDNLGYALFQEIEKSKIALSSQAATDLHFLLSAIPFQASISSTEFQAFTHEETSAILHCMDALLAKNHLSPSQIDAVFLTGGSGQLPAIRQQFAERFGAAKLHTGDFFLSVAKGLALSAPQFYPPENL